jgi:hypothetical protein
MMIRNVRRLLYKGALPAVLVLLTGPTASADPAQSKLQTSDIQHACAFTLGLDPSTEAYASCIKVLERSVANAYQAQAQQSARERARQGCARQGLATSTPEFDVCVVRAEDTPVHSAAAN